MIFENEPGSTELSTIVMDTDATWYIKDPQRATADFEGDDDEDFYDRFFGLICLAIDSGQWHQEF
jgi:hypothetical protein